MDVAKDVIELFSVKDTARAREIAERLNKLNGERQEEERRILQEVETRFEQEPTLRDAYCLIVDGEGWHRGVIGITATRVVEKFGRPTLVISRDGDEAHGSGRSIHAFHLLNALDSCADLFDRYGGHAHAVGFALPCARVPELRAQLDSYARSQLTPADFEPLLEVEAEIGLDQVTPELFNLLQRLEPFGMGNPEPVFASRNVRLTQPPRILKEKHVKLKLGSTENRELRTENATWRRAITYSAMAWRMAERLQQEQLLPGDLLDIAFTIGHNDHPEFGGLELTLCDFASQPRSASVTSAASARAPQ
jgi:single-stranded-DNA-specific exonuclease